MRKFLAFVAVVLIVLAGVGYYRGWYDLSAQNTGTESNIHLKVNREKVGEDAKEALDKAKELGGKTVEKVEEIRK